MISIRNNTLKGGILEILVLKDERGDCEKENDKLV